MRAVGLGGLDVLVCNVGGEVLAYADRCPHLGGRLSEGRFDGEVITCAAHEWCFDARSGGGVNPRRASLAAFPVRVSGDDVFVDLSSASP